MEQNIKTEKVRTFGGKTEFVLTEIDTTSPETIAKTTEKRESDKRERHFYQRMLRAYLKGKEYFYFGYRYSGFNKIPVQYKVLVNWV